jgi:hypothetical protein
VRLPGLCVEPKRRSYVGRGHRDYSEGAVPDCFRATACRTRVDRPKSAFLLAALAKAAPISDHAHFGQAFQNPSVSMQAVFCEIVNINAPERP